MFPIGVLHGRGYICGMMTNMMMMAIIGLLGMMMMMKKILCGTMVIKNGRARKHKLMKNSCTLPGIPIV